VPSDGNNNLHFLTQIISGETISDTCDDLTSKVELEKKLFHDKFMELIKSLDKAKRHRESIRDALNRGRVLPGLRIKTTSNVMKKEPNFTTSGTRSYRRLRQPWPALSYNT